MEHDGQLTPTHAGTVSAFAGSGQRGSSNGVGSSASFNNPRGITIDQQTGNVFVSDYSNHSIRKITPQGVCMKTCLSYFVWCWWQQKERSQRLLGRNKALQIRTAKQQSSVILMGYALTRTASHCLCVIISTTSSDGCSSMVPHPPTLLPHCSCSSLIIWCRRSDNLVRHPRSFLCCSHRESYCSCICRGKRFVQSDTWRYNPPNSLTASQQRDICWCWNQDHKSAKWRWSRGPEEVQGRTDNLMNAASILP